MTSETGTASPTEATGPSGRPPVGRKVLTKEEHGKLLNYHMVKVRTALKATVDPRAKLDEANADVTAAINEAKADLGKRYTRKRLMRYAEDLNSRLRDLVVEAAQEHDDRLLLGLPVANQQADLFGDDKTPQEARDELEAESDGYLVGRAGRDRTPPEYVQPRFQPSWLKGWDNGQAETQRMFLEGQELQQQRAGPDAEAEAVELNGDGDDDGDDDGDSDEVDDDEAEPGHGVPAPQHAETPDPDEVKAQARALEARGFAPSRRRPALKAVH